MPYKVSPNKFELAQSLLIALLGAGVMIGWHQHFALILQIYPSFAPMQFNSALSFLCIGLGIFFLQLSKPLLTRMLGTTVLFIASLTFCQFLTGQDLGIDQLFIKHYLAINTSSPGRMGPNTALCFILVSCGLLVASSSLRARVRATLIGLIGASMLSISLIALAGYLFHFELAYGWGKLTDMAANTALGFVIIGQQLLRLGTRDQKISKIPGIGIGLLALLLTTWQALESQSEVVLRTQARQCIDQTKLYFQDITSSSVQSLQRMVKRLESSNEAMAVWQQEAPFYVEDFDFLSLSLYDNHARLTLEQGTSDEVSDLAEAVNEQLSSTDAKHNTRVQLLEISSYPAPLLVETVSMENGYVIAIFSLKQVLDKAREKTQDLDYPVTVKLGGRTLLQEPSDGKWSIETTLDEAGINLSLAMTPTREQHALSHLYKVVLAAVVIISVLLLFAFYWIEVAIAKASEARLLQAKVQASLSLRQRVIDKAPYGILLVGKDQRVELANDAAESLFGAEHRELLGVHFDALLPEGIDGTAQIYAKRRDDELVPIEVSQAHVHNDGREGLVVILVDVRERLKAQQLIETQMSKLEKINGELNSFTYIASHDLKSPLRGIDQLASWISEDLGEDVPAETQHHLTLMRSRIIRMERLLDDLLAYARIGRIDYGVDTVQTAELVQEIFEYLAPGKPIKLEIVEGMPSLLTQKVPLELVFRNLISNAIKHNDKSDACISVSARAAGKFIAFSVTDNGPGIPEEHRERVFDMFQTLKPRDEVEGSGIGLALVRKTVESLGGNVTLESSPDKGCTFVFTWPKSIQKE